MSIPTPSTANTPPLIRSRYEQYKRDTEQFTTWLAQTAISLGYPTSNFEKGVEEKPEGTVQTAKSKRRAQKKARAKEKVKLERDEVDGGKTDEGPKADSVPGRLRS
jgi:hypothetical protein